VAGRLYGTLAFLTRSLHQRLFTSTELELLRLMAQWLGGEIEREQRAEQLHA
jgi:GAF domain-containing protein